MSSMDGQGQAKLKSVLQNVPSGFLVDTRWLDARGISRQSASAYAKEGWLERLTQGVYRRPVLSTERPDAAREWKLPVLSAQRLVGYRFHVGGTSALDLHGFSHYLPLGGRSVLYLYGDDVPKWLGKLKLDATIVHRKSSLFSDPVLGIENEDFSIAALPAASQNPWNWPLRTSSPERAILEALDEVPHSESFHAVDVLFESLVNLRPKLLAALLAECRSVKTKRLFFVYADKHEHSWRKYLDPQSVDLGSGDRALAEGGKLHPHYHVTVPADLMPKGAADGP